MMRPESNCAHAVVDSRAEESTVLAGAGPEGAPGSSVAADDPEGAPERAGLCALDVVAGASCGGVWARVAACVRAKLCR